MVIDETFETLTFSELHIGENNIWNFYRYMYDSSDAAKYVSAVDPATSTPAVVAVATATAAETDGK